jgi:hypothetical protein
MELVVVGRGTQSLGNVRLNRVTERRRSLDALDQETLRCAAAFCANLRRARCLRQGHAALVFTAQTAVKVAKTRSAPGGEASAVDYADYVQSVAIYWYTDAMYTFRLSTVANKRDKSVKTS